MSDLPETSASNPAADEVPTKTAQGAAVPHELIGGKYKLIEPLGQGGMGVVYLAEQSQPVRRLVALKIIKPGMDSGEVLARFEAERQALALMDHPHIAKVLDAGTTEQGRPYFVMELVKGQPITQYCDQHQLSPRARLELLVAVCQAVQHAHQKAIIHRDLKPSNVLVAQYDGRPMPKVIDFGVAKAMGQQLTDNTLVTGFGALVGTLEYMSPEQAQLNQLDVDTRSDIYALGVILYELLTGSTPFDRRRLRGAAILEMLRVIREEEPPTPSTRLSTVAGLPSIAAKRGMDPKRLSGTVRGELDWIVMKALDKDRNRRYETANGLALDLQRYLADEPVLACPASATYRLRKLISKHRTVVAFGSIVGLLVLVGLVGLAVSRQLILHERDATALALVAKNEAWESEREARYEEEQQRALAVARQQEAEAQKDRADRNFRTAREAVDRMLTRVAHELRGQPQTEQLRRELLEDALKFQQEFLQDKGDDPEVRFEAGLSALRIGNLRSFLSQIQDAATNFQEALSIFEQLRDEDPENLRYQEQVIAAGNALASAEIAQNRIESGWSRLQAALEASEKLAAARPDRPDYLQQAASLNLSAAAHWHGQYSFLKSQPYTARVQVLLAELARRFPEYPVDPLLQARMIAVIPASEANPEQTDLVGAPGKRNYAALPHDPETLAKYEEELKQTAAYWEQQMLAHPDAPAYQRTYLQAVGALAKVLFAQDREQDIERLLANASSSAAELARRFPEHPEHQLTAAWELYVRAGCLYYFGHRDQAVDRYRQSIAVVQSLATRFADNKRYQTHMYGMLNGCPVPELQDPERAIAAAKAVLEIGDDYGWTWGELAYAQVRAGRLDEARQSLQTARAKIGPNAEILPIERLDLLEAQICLEMGELDRARQLFRGAVQKIDSTTNRVWFTPEYRNLRNGLAARLEVDLTTEAATRDK